MKSKKFLSALLVFALSLSMLAACAPDSGQSSSSAGSGGSGQSGSSAGDTSEEKVRVGLCINSLDETQTRAIEARNKYLAETYPEIELTQISAEGKLENQISIVESFVADGMDYIVVQPLDPDGTSVCVDIAHEAGIPCISFMDKINHEDLDLHIAMPITDLGALQGVAVGYFLEENPDVNLKAGVILGDIAMQIVWDAREALDESLAEWVEAGRIEIIAEKTANWKTDEAMALTEDWLQAYPEMNCILSFNDEMAFGALQALQAAGKNMGEDYFLFGRDGSERGLQELRDGNMAGSVYIDSMGMQIGFMDPLVGYIRSEITEKEVKIPVESCLAAINKDNLDETLAYFAELIGE